MRHICFLDYYYDNSRLKLNTFKECVDLDIVDSVFSKTKQKGQYPLLLLFFSFVYFLVVAVLYLSSPLCFILCASTFSEVSLSRYDLCWCVKATLSPNLINDKCAHRFIDVYRCKLIAIILNSTKLRNIQSRS